MQVASQPEALVHRRKRGEEAKNKRVTKFFIHHYSNNEWLRDEANYVIRKNAQPGMKIQTLTDGA